MKTAAELARLAEANGWSSSGLEALLGIDHDRTNNGGLVEVIELSIAEGEDPEWIQERVSERPLASSPDLEGMELIEAAGESREVLLERALTGLVEAIPTWGAEAVEKSRESVAYAFACLLLRRPGSKVEG